MNELQNLKCLPCNAKTSALTDKEINEEINNLSNWNINQERKMIFKKYNFKNFNKSLNFVNMLGVIAEQEGHHPDISFSYSYCLVMIHTHAIKGLSINDFILASKIDLINY